MEAVNNFGDNIKNQVANIGDGMKDRLSGLGLSTQDPFYMYVALGALIVLIIVLIALGVMMSELKSKTLFPPSQNACPDYWDLSSNGQCIYPSAGNTDKNIGTGIITRDGATAAPKNYIGINTPGFARWGTELYVSDGTTRYTAANAVQQNYKYVSLSDPSGIAGMAKLYPGLTTRCAQKKWANNNNIIWDGVTNFNGC